jgi:hypothetical protein
MSEQYDALVAKYRAARAARDERRKVAVVEGSQLVVRDAAGRLVGAHSLGYSVDQAGFARELAAALGARLEVAA